MPHLSHYLGWLNTPRHNGDFKAYERFFVPLPVAADNSAFVGFDEKRYLRFVAKTPAYIEWITAPDKVANAEMTLDLFERWYPRIQHLPLALVGQDGMEDKELPWSHALTASSLADRHGGSCHTPPVRLAVEAKHRGETPAHGEGQQQYAVTLCLQFETVTRWTAQAIRASRNGF